MDPKTELRDAQVQDLSDATYHGNTSTRVRAAEHAEAGQCDIIIVTAGAAQKKGEIFPVDLLEGSLLITDFPSRRIPHRPHRPQSSHSIQRDRRHEALQQGSHSSAHR